MVVITYRGSLIDFVFGLQRPMIHAKTAKAVVKGLMHSLKMNRQPTAAV